ncbi:hypothetical protein [Ruegeria marina]|uniref:Uncharacterized protein n=1 Tax=Ruegeria marina TaxID=639004 RepID=A0A1G7CEM3_9RHOB|nr:hypothetical protein [Ruegeria marina]SDE37749.1 hypothetical protein SAMN04488239_11819 [Ruegeria marina]
MLRLVRFWVATGSLALAHSAIAAEPTAQHNTNAFWFENWGSLTNATLVIESPSGKIYEVRAASGTPVFQLSGQETMDGVYSYELSAATDEQETIANPIDNGRGSAARDTRAKPYYLTGAFHVSRGVIITPEKVSEDGD